MRKKIFIFSVVCLLFISLNFTYASLKNTITGNIVATSNTWAFKASIDGATIEDDGYKIPTTQTSGSFTINFNTTGGTSNAKYAIELTGPTGMKFYSDSAKTKEISGTYSGTISQNTTSSVTIYYTSSTTGNIIVKCKGNKVSYAMMKNGKTTSSDTTTEFWASTYAMYIRTTTFGNDLSNLPANCTASNLCWDVSYNANQTTKVYAYLKDSGYKDSTDSTKTLYDLYIVSEATIMAPISCNYMFWHFKNMVSLNFNNNFYTDETTSMTQMFYNCAALTSIDLSTFNTSKVTAMNGMFNMCGFTSIDVSGFDTSKVTTMAAMFFSCPKLTSLDLSNFDTSNVTNMQQMFYYCIALKTLNISNFNTSKVTSMWRMFYSTYYVQATLNVMNQNVSSYDEMFVNCAIAGGGKVTINYVQNAYSLVTNMIATKSDSSNVVRGTVITA